jgi:protein involved in polysaccharide export with SLBB domain
VPRVPDQLNTRYVAARRHRRADVPQAASNAGSSGATLAVTLLVSLCLPGCHADRRISMQELLQREQEAKVCSPTPVKPAELELSDLHGYRIQPRDVLVVRMIGLSPADRYAETVVPVRVGEDGKIVMPIVGPIQAAGLELGQLEREIIAAHVPSVARDLTVYVEVAGPEATTVLVLGAALTPGLVRLPQNQRNIFYALSSAGAFGPPSSYRVRLKPIRPERPELVYDFLDQNDVRRALQAPPLEPGDTLVVEAEGNPAVYVAGLVNHPGMVPVPTRSSISLMGAIAASGGLVDFLDPDEATLWRTLDNGDRCQAKIDLAAIQSGCEADPVLRPGDVVIVPPTAKTRIRQWAMQNLQFGPFGMTAVYDPIAIYEARLISNNNNNVGARAAVLGGITSSAVEAVVPPVVAPASVAP